MPTIEKADRSMFDEIHALLGEFGPRAQARPRDQWLTLFDNGWDRDDNPLGYVTIVEGKIVGFLSTIFSQRMVEGRIETFCNLSSWIVRTNAATGRPYSGIHMLAEVTRQEHLHLTSLTPAPSSLKIGKALGFRQLEAKVRVIPEARSLPELDDNRYSIATDPTEIEALLGPIERRIFRDHVRFDCYHLALHGEGRSCYVVFTKSGRYGVNHIHHVSDPALFAEHARGVVRAIALRNDVDTVAIEPRLIDDIEIPLGFERETEWQGSMYRSNLDRHHVDNLYSELILLGL